MEVPAELGFWIVGVVEVASDAMVNAMLLGVLSHDSIVDEMFLIAVDPRDWV